MKVKELIEKLQKYDGENISIIAHMWPAKVIRFDDLALREKILAVNGFYEDDDKKTNFLAIEIRFR